MEKIKVFLILLIACVCCYLSVSLLSGLLLGPAYEVYIPEDGTWYCQSLGISLSFDESQESYFLNKGNTIHCVWENDRGSKAIMVFCQEDVPNDFMIGDLIFCGQYVSLDVAQYVVEDVDTGKIYTFIRQQTR